MKLSSVFWLSRLCGVFPYDGDGISTKWFALSVVVHTASLLSMAYFLREMASDDRPTLKLYVDLVRIILIYMSVVVHTFSTFFNVEFFPAVKPLLNTPTPVLVSFSALLFHVAVTIALMCTIDVNSYVLYLRTTANLLFAYVSLLIVLQYGRLIDLNSKRINDCGLSAKTCPMMSCANIQSTSILVEKIHKYYSPFLLVFILRIEITLICFGYLSFASNEPPIKFKSIITVVENLIWLLMIVWPSSEAENQLNSFYEILFRIITRDSTLYNNKQLELYLLVPRKLNFSVCGLFSLRLPLFLSIVASSSTFIFILIQFN